MSAFQPGQIYLAYAGGDKYRPVLVVSREELNRGKYVVAVPFTSTRFSERSNQPSCVPFRAGDFGLEKDCVVQAEAITLFNKDEFDLETGLLAEVDDEKMREVTKAIGYVITAECEPE